MCLMGRCCAQWAWPFNEPVELDRYPDYTKVVKQPMDFGTIKQRLEAGAYGSPQQFAADMALIWANARAYNAAGTDVWHMAGMLQVRAAALLSVHCTFSCVSTAETSSLGVGTAVACISQG